MNSADIPMHIEPADYGYNMVRLALIVAVLTSAGWAWMLNEERAANDLLLADAVARMTPIRSLTISYANGASATVNMKEVQP